MFDNTVADEICERVYMSGFWPPRDAEYMKKLGITHILCVTASRPPKESIIKYLIFNEIKDDDC